MLERIRLKAYKSIREADIQLGRLNVLIGSNGAGKSNLISVFRLLNQLVQQQLQVHVLQNGGADLFLHYGRRASPQLKIELLWHDTNEYRCSLVPTAEGSLIFMDERCLYGMTNRNFGLGSGHRESELPNEARRWPGGVAEYVLHNLQSYRLYHFHDTSDVSKVKQLQDINDNQFLRPDASNLAAFLYMLQRTQRTQYDLIVRTVRLAAPFFGDFTLRPSPFNPNSILLEWQELGTDAYFNAGALSDGTLRFICLSTLLLQPPSSMPTTILLDEPELGLHPYAIVLLAGLMQKASSTSQVLAATQSVQLVDQMEPENLIVVDRTAHQSLFRRLDARAVRTWLEDYTLGELWQKNLLGGQPHNDAAYIPGSSMAGPLGR